jgi:hypothetical protein
VSVIACLVGLSLVAVIAVAGVLHARHASGPSPTEPFFDGLGGYTRKVTTQSALAQRYFDQGLAFLYGFNHFQAERSFRAACEIDPKCAMAWWGIALANGPDINNSTVIQAQAETAIDALGKAREFAADATPVERALIGAAETRYAVPAPKDRQALDKAYAAAMRQNWRAFPDDADVGALAAEAILDLRPWDQWTADGKPQPGTDDTIDILRAVLAKSPEHPFALHLFIHTVEGSPHPEWADAAADRLRDLAPGLEHILHMPSHIDLRKGCWQAAIVANQRAIAADVAFCRLGSVDDSHELWMAHDYHTLAYAALMLGQSALADQAIAEMMLTLSDSNAPRGAVLSDVFLAMPFELHLRFGRWDAMLAEPHPPDQAPVASAFWRFARATAFAAKKDLVNARAERRDFLASVDIIEADPELRWHPGRNLLPVAKQMLEGEILYREGHVEAALADLRKAVATEDHLPFQQPPFLMLHPRHVLGAVLLDCGLAREGELVYRDDLARHPKNVWSLTGLARSLGMQSKIAEATSVTTELTAVVQQADVRVSSSCCCLPARQLSHNSSEPCCRSK